MMMMMMIIGTLNLFKKLKLCHRTGMRETHEGDAPATTKCENKSSEIKREPEFLAQKTSILCIVDVDKGIQNLSSHNIIAPKNVLTSPSFLASFLLETSNLEVNRGQ
jgi:hypothetical protein